MTHIQTTSSEPFPTVKCLVCGKDYEYDPVMGWGCLTLIDETTVPRVILGAWCDKKCLNEWLNTPGNRESLTSE